jgi:carboxylesterase
MSAPILPGAEPFSADGGPHGVLVIHGLTGNCFSVRSLAQRFAAAGWAVECPLLPGHGTDVADMIPTRWSDWAPAAEAANESLSNRVDGRVIVAGLSMGGTLAVWLASRHPEIAGLVCINPLVAPVGQIREIVLAGAEMGQESMPAIGSDIADPEVTELSYPATPLRCLVSLFDAVDELQPALVDVVCPMLLVTSEQDHVVPPFNSDHLAAAVGGPVERMLLERSYHVATLDYEKREIEDRAIDFATKIAETA